MSIVRDLTEAETQRLLTRAEVEALPPGTVLMIKFCGGMGPVAYTVGRDQWGACTIVPTDHPHPLRAWLDTRQVGPMRWHHRCFLRDADTP